VEDQRKDWERFTKDAPNRLSDAGRTCGENLNPTDRNGNAGNERVSLRTKLRG